MMPFLNVLHGTQNQIYAFTSCSAAHRAANYHSGGTIMGSTTDKIKGTVNQGAGEVKQDLGHAVGNPNLEVEGAAQKLTGKAQEAIGQAKDAVKKIVDKA
jgi:uncharacterized protein YjbJ (UPF0337 family)